MAIIQGQQQDNTNTNLNSGMNSTNSGSNVPGSNSQPSNGMPSSSGAVTANGQQASGQGGGSVSTPGSAAPKTPSSGQFTNFNNYTQDNQKAVGRLDNLLNTNFNQQGQQEQNTLSNTNQVAQGVQASNQQINQGLTNVNNALSTGDFSSFFNPNSNIAPQTGTQTANIATPGTNSTTQNTSQANNPVYQNLNTWASNLANGVTNQGALQNQANNIYTSAGNNVQNMQTQQGLLKQQGGVGTILNSLLGANGRYGQGANNLDQSLIQGNSANYSNILNNAANSVTTGQNNLTNTQNNINGQLTGLGQNALAAKQQLQGTNGILNTGLNTLNTNLTNQASTAEQQRQAQQLDILNQFNTDTFNQNTANQLGLQNGTTLFGITQGNGQNYNINKASDLANYQNSPYLGLNQNQVTNANVVSGNQLGEYAALQKMLGNVDPSQYTYNQTGTVDPAYTLNNQKFDTDLSNLYNTRAQQALADTVTGHGQQDWSSGLFGTNHGTAYADASQNVSNLVNVGALQQAAAQGFAPINQPTSQVGGTLTPTSPNLNTFGPGASQAISGLAQTMTGNPGEGFANQIGGASNLINSLGSRLSDQLGTALFGGGTQGSSQGDANAQALANIQNAWNSYQNNMGYNNIAQIAQPNTADMGMQPQVMPAVNKILTGAF